MLPGPDAASAVALLLELVRWPAGSEAAVACPACTALHRALEDSQSGQALATCSPA